MIENNQNIAALSQATECVIIGGEVYYGDMIDSRIEALIRRIITDNGQIDSYINVFNSNFIKKRYQDLGITLHFCFVGGSTSKIYSIVPGTNHSISRTGSRTLFNSQGKLVEINENVPAFQHEPLGVNFEGQRDYQGLSLTTTSKNSVINSVSDVYTHVNTSAAHFVWEFTEIYTHAVSFGNNSLARSVTKADSITQASNASFCFSFFIKMDDNSTPVAGLDNNVLADFSIYANNVNVLTAGGRVEYRRINRNEWRVFGFINFTGTTSGIFIKKFTTQSAKSFKVTGLQYSDGNIRVQPNHLPTRGTVANKGVEVLQMPLSVAVNDIVVYCEMTFLSYDLPTGTRGIQFDCPTNGDRIIVGFSAIGNVVLYIQNPASLGGGTIVQIDTPGTYVGQKVRVAARIQQGQYALFVNGTKFTTVTSGNINNANIYTTSSNIRLTDSGLTYNLLEFIVMSNKTDAFLQSFTSFPVNNENLVARPDGFTMPYNFNIYKNATTGKFTTDLIPDDFRLNTGATFYFSPNGLSGNDGLTELTPKNGPGLKTFIDNLTYAANPTGVTIIVAPGDYSFSGNATIANLKTHFNIICPNGKATFHTRISASFTLESGTVYKHIWTSSTANGQPTVVVDYNNLDEFGNAKPLNRLEIYDLPSLQAYPNSYFVDTATKTLWIHTFDSRVPDANIQCLANVIVLNQQTNNYSLYMDGIRIETGGQCPIRIREATAVNYAKSYFFKNCDYVYSGGSPYVAIDTNGFYFLATNVPVLSYGCRTFWTMRDGFNYYGTSAGVEIRCSGAYYGIVHPLNASQNNASNASTVHNGTSIVRIDCDYSKANDRIIQDINNGTQTWMLGCRVGNGVKASVADYYNSCNYMFGSNGTTQTVKAWLDSCESYNNHGDLIVGAGSVVKMRNCIGFTNIRIDAGGLLENY